jgi:hypothetical protein
VSGVPNVNSISVLCFLFVCLCPVSGRDTVNIGYTRHRIKTKQNTIQRYCQLWVHQTQDKDKKNTTQRYCQHWVHQTDVDSISVLCFLFVCLCSVSGVPNVDSISVLCFLFVCLYPVSGVPNVDSISVLCFVLSLSCALGTPDTGQRQTNKNTIQRYCQHWEHQTQDKNKQKKNTTQRYCQHWVHQTRLSLSCVWCTQC